MTTMFVIDSRSRSLATFVANVTQAEAGLVVRAALELPGLRELTELTGVNQPFRTGMPVLILGEGRSAPGSGGFVQIREGVSDGRPRHYSTAVVGVMPFGASLKNTRPFTAKLYEGARILRENVFTNSNWSSADAALEGAKLLETTMPDCVWIWEGQSDYAVAYRLTAGSDSYERRRHWELPDVSGLTVEHRRERFTFEAVTRDMVMALNRLDERRGGYDPPGYALGVVRKRLGLDPSGSWPAESFEEVQAQDPAFFLWEGEVRAEAYAIVAAEITESA